jgi:RNA polymerase sigma factor (sigma-70 family)
MLQQHPFLKQFLFGFFQFRRFNSEQLMIETRILLAEYVRNGSEAAFEELVRRYADLVHSTAARLVSDDPHLAKDVAQTVFLRLARKAHRLPDRVMLGGWLHQDTCHVAATVMRSERRRQARERDAVAMGKLNDSNASLDQIAPVLDEAIGNLGKRDRTAILLRFYEHLDFRSVGEALDSSEDAARMRVSRALEKLQIILKRRGISISATALGTVLATHAVEAAPAGLAASLAGAALASGAARGGVSLTIVKALTMSKIKVGIVGAVAVATMGVPIVVQRQAQIQLHEENKSLGQRLDQLAPLQAEAERLSNLVAQANTRQAFTSQNFEELARLRGEVGQLRRENREIEELRQQVKRLSVAAAAPAIGATDQTLVAAGQPVMRVYRVDPDTLLHGLNQSVRSEPSEGFQQRFQRFLEAKGVELQEPATVTFDERRGVLVISAKPTDHDLIEKLIAGVAASQE